MKIDKASLSPVTILMTATVTPATGMPGSRRNDSALRLEEYIGAFKFYSSLSDQLVNRIILLENSNCDLSIFRDILRENGAQKELVAINTSADYDGTKGKGYAEFKMIDVGLRQALVSGFINGSTKIWKVTGRLIIENIDALVSSSPLDYAVYCDLRSVPLIGERLGGNNWMDLRVFSFTVDGYQKYFYKNYDSGRVTEKAFFKIMMLGMATDGNISPRFRLQPRVIGYCGNNNKSYTDASYRAKDRIRQIGRQLIPGLWL